MTAVGMVITSFLAIEWSNPNTAVMPFFILERHRRFRFRHPQMEPVLFPSMLNLAIIIKEREKRIANADETVSFSLRSASAFPRIAHPFAFTLVASSSTYLRQLIKKGSGQSHAFFVNFKGDPSPSSSLHFTVWLSAHPAAVGCACVSRRQTCLLTVHKVTAGTAVRRCGKDRSARWAR